MVKEIQQPKYLQGDLTLAKKAVRSSRESLGTSLKDVVRDKERRAEYRRSRSEEFEWYYSQQVGERKRSQTGLVNNLVGRHIIEVKHVDADGSIRIDALRGSEYFGDKQEVLDALQGYTLSERSSIRQKADALAHQVEEKQKLSIVDRWRRRALIGVALAGGIVLGIVAERELNKYSQLHDSKPGQTYALSENPRQNLELTTLDQPEQVQEQEIMQSRDASRLTMPVDRRVRDSLKSFGEKARAVTNEVLTYGSGSLKRLYQSWQPLNPVTDSKMLETRHVITGLGNSEEVPLTLSSLPLKQPEEPVAVETRIVHTSTTIPEEAYTLNGHREQTLEISTLHQPEKPMLPENPVIASLLETRHVITGQRDAKDVALTFKPLLQKQVEQPLRLKTRHVITGLEKPEDVILTFKPLLQKQVEQPLRLKTRHVITGQGNPDEVPLTFKQMPEKQYTLDELTAKRNVIWLSGNERGLQIYHTKEGAIAGYKMTLPENTGIEKRKGPKRRVVKGLRERVADGWGIYEIILDPNDPTRTIAVWAQKGRKLNSLADPDDMSPRRVLRNDGETVTVPAKKIYELIKREDGKQESGVTFTVGLPDKDGNVRTFARLATDPADKK